MSTFKLPLLGDNLIDLKARATNKALRDFCAQAVAQRDAYKARCMAQHETLEACLVLLAEARTALLDFIQAELPVDRALVDRITELVGDGEDG